jgi:NAD(P)H dehydrogenase (quinone)
MGARAFPLVDTRDVSQAAAVVLRDPASHTGQAYALTGPQALNYHEVAAAIGELVGKDVTYRTRSPQEFRGGLVDAGIPEWRAEDLADISAAYTDDDNEPADGLHALLGRPATSLTQFLADHRDRYESGLSRSHL